MPPRIRKQRRGFTLVELVVVVILMGILVAIAAGNFSSWGLRGRENVTYQNLRRLREAVKYHVVLRESLPGDLGTDADFRADLESFLNAFPRNLLNDSDRVDVSNTGDDLVSVAGTAGWRYDNVTGQIIVNSAGSSNVGVPYVKW